MSKILFRIIAFLLISCLIVDPDITAVLSQQSIVKHSILTRASAEFSAQALAPPSVVFPFLRRLLTSGQPIRRTIRRFLTDRHITVGLPRIEWEPIPALSTNFGVFIGGGRKVRWLALLGIQLSKNVNPQSSGQNFGDEKVKVKFGDRQVALPAYLTIAKHSDFYGQYVGSVLNVLEALEESIQTEPKLRKSRNDELTKKYHVPAEMGSNLDEVASSMSGGDLLRRGDKYDLGEGFSDQAIGLVSHGISDFLPEHTHINESFLISYEIAATGVVSVNRQTKKVIDDATKLVTMALDPESSLPATYSTFMQSEHATLTLAVKWLANVAEADDLHTSPLAKDFLTFFVHQTLTDNKDALEAFSAMVFAHTKQARDKFGSGPGHTAVEIVVMMSGGEPLGYWLKAKAAQLGEQAPIKTLMLTTAMAQKIPHYLDFDTVFLKPEGVKMLTNYLWANEVAIPHVRHVVFVDTGFGGSINRYFFQLLTHFLNMSEDYLILAHASSGLGQSYLAHGLNDEPKWKGTEKRLKRIAEILDEVFEHSILSSRSMEGKPTPTFRPWFAQTVKQEIENLATQDILSPRNRFPGASGLVVFIALVGSLASGQISVIREALAAIQMRTHEIRIERSLSPPTLQAA